MIITSLLGRHIENYNSKSEIVYIREDRGIVYLGAVNPDGVLTEFHAEGSRLHVEGQK